MRKLLRSIFSLVMAASLAIVPTISVYAADDEYVYNGNFDLEDFRVDEELDIGETMEYTIIVQRADDYDYEEVNNKFLSEYTLRASVAEGGAYISNFNTSGSKLSFKVRDVNTSSDEDVVIKIEATPRRSNSEYSKVTNEFRLKYPSNSSGGGNSGSSGKDTVFVDSDEYTISEGDDVKLEFDSSLLKCEIDFDGYAKYTIKFGNKDTYSFKFTTKGNNYVYNLNNYDEDDELYFLNFEKISGFEFEEDFYIDDQGCKNLYTVDSKGYAQKVNARRSGGYFIVRDTKKIEKNYVITDKRLKMKSSSSNSSGNNSDSNKTAKATYDVTRASFVVPKDKDCTLEFSDKLFKSQLQFSGLGLYTAKLGKNTKFSIEYNTEPNKYVYHVNGLPQTAGIKFLNFVKSPKFEFKNTLYIKHFGYKYLYEIDTKGYATRLSPSVAGDWFALPEMESFKSYAITNHALVNKDGAKAASAPTTANKPQVPTTKPSTSSNSTSKAKADEAKKAADAAAAEAAKKAAEVVSLTPSTVVTMPTKTIKTVLDKTAINGTAVVHVANNDVINVKELKTLMNSHSSKLLQFVHKVGDKIDYQITMNNAQIQKIKSNTIVIGMDTTALDTAYQFAKYYSNDFYGLRHNNYIGSGASANFAVRITDANIKTLKKMESTIRVYQYDVNKNNYVLVANPYVWLDKNNYLHFTAEVGYDYVFSSGPIQER